MQLRDIAWASLKRRRGRSMFAMAAVALGIGTVVALVSLSRAMRAEVGDELDRFGANIVITPKATSLDVAYGGIAVAGLTVDAQELRTSDADAIRTIPNKRNLSAVAPKLIGTLEIEGQRALLIGVRFRDESGVKSWWQIDGRLARHAGEVMMGSDAARALGKKTGDRLTLAGDPREVVGVIAPNGSLDDQAVLTDLGVAQQALGKPDAVTMIEVSALCRGCPIEDIVSQMAAVLPHARVAPIRQAVAVRERAVLQFSRFAYAVSGIVLLVGTVVVLTTMMASVAERTQEIGILRAVGYRRTQVARVILFEALAVNLAGGVVGWLAGFAASRALGPAMAQLTTPIPLDFTLGAAAILTALVLGAAGGSYPAIRAAGMDPAQALRHL
jgi:putative ABC transport system permease protein